MEVYGKTITGLGTNALTRLRGCAAARLSIRATPISTKFSRRKEMGDQRICSEKLSHYCHMRIRSRNYGRTNHFDTS